MCDGQTTSNRHQATVKRRAWFEIYLIITLTIIISISLNSSSAFAANSEPTSCCKKAKDGQTCVSNIEQDQCLEGFNRNVDCNSLDICANRGCCEVNNICTKGALQGSCSGQFYPDVECNVDQCKPKCCVLGNNCGLMNVNSCEQLGGTLNPDVTDMLSCNNLCQAKTSGCCRTGEKCEYTTGDLCEGDFFTNQRCDRVENCECKNDNPTTGCVGNDLYKYDSCNNPTLVKKCDSTNGELCSDNDGDGTYACEDMNCKITYDNPLVDENLDGILDNDGGFRKNGESWCEYQSAVGPGMDLPGTSHYLHSCINGKEEVQECSGLNDRSKICVYFSVDDSNNYPLFSGSGQVAKCIPNPYEECIECNKISLDPKERETEETRASCCKAEGKLCQWMGVGKSKKLKGAATGIEFYFVVDSNIKKNKLKETTGKIAIADKEIEGKLSEIKLAFNNSKNERVLVKGLNEAERISDEEKDGKTAYNYLLDIDFENVAKENLGMYVLHDGKEEFVTSIEALPTLDEQGKCLPLVPPGNLPVKINTKSEGQAYDEQKYSKMKTESGEFCDLASEKEIKIGWLEEFWGTDFHCRDNCELYPERNKTFMYGQNFICNGFGDCGAKWNVLGRWSSQGYYFDCGDHFGNNDIKEECKVRKYYITTPPEQFSFDKYRNVGKGLFLGKVDIDFAELASREISGDAKYFFGNFFARIFTGTQFGTSMLWGLSAAVIFVAYYAGFAVGVAIASAITGVAVSVSAGPIGWIVAVALIIWNLVNIIFELLRDYEIKEASTSCNVWQPPKENQCWKCNTLVNETTDHKACDSSIENCGLVPIFGNKVLDAYECNPKTCSSLGKNCVWADSAEGPKCIEVEKRDSKWPNIKIKNIDYTCEIAGACNLQSGNNEAGIQGVTEITGELKPGHKLGIRLETTNPENNGPDLTLCRYSFDGRTVYDEMGNIENEYSFEHYLELNSLEPGDRNIYFACEDISGNHNDDKYSLKVKIAQYPDISAPIILGINTPTGIGNWNKDEGQKGTAYVPYGKEDLNVELILNEKATNSGCRWTNLSADRAYDDMGHSFTCLTSSDARDPYSCSGNIPYDSNKVWFRCVDKEGNKALQSLPYEGFKIKRADELKIIETKCVGEFGDKCEGKIYDKSLSLEIKTGGGMDGNSDCTWDSGYGELEFFEGQGTSDHTQKTFTPNNGENKIKFKCKDKIGNVAINEVTFTYEKDTDAPQISRLYKDGNQLKLETSELATCKYSDTSEFDFEKAAEFSKDSDGLKHSMTFENNFYKVACQDRFGNLYGPFNVYTSEI